MLHIYEINDDYIEYLESFDNRVAYTKKGNRTFKRKYVGIVLKINNCNYFASLSSFKPKHKNMKTSLDFIKLRDLAVINMNNMIPVPLTEVTQIDFNSIQDKNYANLLSKEYKLIKKMEINIQKKAENLYKHKITNGNNTPLSKRCCDFKLLEEKMKEYNPNLITI